MAGYTRKTSLSPREIFERAGSVLPDRVGLECSGATSHRAVYSGGEGTVTITAHRHSQYTEVVAETDGLRTSRIDYEVQKFLNRLPYEIGDRGGPGSGEFAGAGQHGG